MDNLIVFSSIRKNTPTGKGYGVLTELEYFDLHKIEHEKANSVAIQAYSTTRGRYSDLTYPNGNYICKVEPEDWSGMLFLDYDMQKDIKKNHKDLGQRVAQQAKQDLINDKRLRPILKMVATSTSGCGLHVILQFYREPLDKEHYALYDKAALRLIKTIFNEEAQSLLNIDEANSRYTQPFFQGYDPDIWLNPDWVKYEYNNVYFSLNVESVLGPACDAYGLHLPDYNDTPLTSAPLLKSAKIKTDAKQIKDGFVRKQITNALVNTFKFDLNMLKSFWSNKTTTDGSPVTTKEVEENYHYAKQADYSAPGIRHLNRLGLLDELVINTDTTIEMHTKFLADMNIDIKKGAFNLIVSPCSSGKTRFAARYQNSVIIEPLIAILDNNFRTVEEIGLSHRKNETQDILTYDQFTKKFNDFMKKKYLIFDECHCVDQMFRSKVFPKLIFLIDKYIDNGGTVIAMTGTPNTVLTHLWPEAEIFNFTREASPKYDFFFTPVLKKDTLFDTALDTIIKNKHEGYSTMVFNNNISMNDLLKEQLVAQNIETHTLSAGDRSWLDKMNESQKLGCDCVLTTSVMREGSEIKEIPDFDNKLFNKNIRCIYIIDSVSCKPQDIIQSMNRIRNQSLLHCDIIANMGKGLKAHQPTTRPDTQLTKHEKLSRMTAFERADLLHDSRTQYEIDEIAFYEALCADESYKYQEARALCFALSKYGDIDYGVSSVEESHIKIKKRDRTEEAKKLIPIIEEQNEDTLSRWSLGLDLYERKEDTKMLQFLAVVHQNEEIFNALKSGDASYSQVEDFLAKKRAINKVANSKTLYSMVDFCIKNPKKEGDKSHQIIKWLRCEDKRMTGASIDYISSIYKILFSNSKWFDIKSEFEGVEYDSFKSICASLVNDSFMAYLEEKERIIKGRAERIKQRQKSYNKVHCYTIKMLTQEEIDKEERRNKLLKKDKEVKRYVIKKTTAMLNKIDDKVYFFEKSEAEKYAKQLLTNKD